MRTPQVKDQYKRLSTGSLYTIIAVIDDIMYLTLSSTFEDAIVDPRYISCQVIPLVSFNEQFTYQEPEKYVYVNEYEEDKCYHGTEYEATVRATENAIVVAKKYKLVEVE